MSGGGKDIGFDGKFQNPDEHGNRSVGKGHEFVRLYVCILRGEQVLTEIMHTAIFQPRKAA